MQECKVYKESNGTVSGTQNVNSSSVNECSIKENENSVSGNENSKSENKSSKSGISSSISGNATKADRADIRPTYDTDSLEQIDNDDYNVFAIEKEHPEQPESVNDTYLVEQDDTNTTPDSSYMSNNGREADQYDDLEKKHRNKTFQNDKPCKNQDAPEFLEFFEINELKAHILDKNIAISELKKLIENIKRKSVDTNFGKPSILGKPPLQKIRNQPVVRQLTAFKSEQSSFSKPWFAFQVVEKNMLTKPVTPHSCPEVRESVFAIPYHVNALGLSMNSSKTVSKMSPRESIGSNDMVHNYYLEEAKKQAQI
ncbi:hypothetical protein Tco_1041806 [Tanacetum coccineum]|uniref:Uncharacterized protein n=1 Tax=Tanacetum coccineum TaxID=301880 RepID=A0ABQ5GHQ7_9ASTR